jgi:hypothetical protein
VRSSSAIVHVVAFGFGVVASSYAQSPQFIEELIKLRVHGEYCTVEGTYSFKNNAATDAVWTVFYPLLNTKHLPFPDSVHVTSLATKGSVPFLAANNGISITVAILPNSVSEYRVFYRQRTPAQTMEYILTTTKHWNSPLRRAMFVIRIPDSFQLTRISIPYDRVEAGQGEKVYLTRKHNFMPEKNLLIRWRKKTR